MITISKENFKNELVDLLGEDGDFAIGLRALWDDEVGLEKLKPSNIWEGREWEIKGRKLSGTSAIEIVGNYGDATGKDIKMGFEKAWELVQKYIRDNGVVAVVKGDLDIDEVADDVGECILKNAEVVAYIK